MPHFGDLCASLQRLGSTFGKRPSLCPQHHTHRAIVCSLSTQRGFTYLSCCLWENLTKPVLINHAKVIRVDRNNDKEQLRHWDDIIQFKKKTPQGHLLKCFWIENESCVSDYKVGADVIFGGGFFLCWNNIGRAQTVWLNVLWLAR